MHQVWTLRHSFWHECNPWTHSTDCKNVCCAQSLSRLFWCSKAKWTKFWGQHFFQIINVTNCCSDFEGTANELEATFAVLQGQQPRHSNPNPCCTSRFRAPTLLTGEEDMNAWLKEISLWSFGWTNHLNLNLTVALVKTKRDKGINCSIDFCKLQSFCLMLEWEKWWNTTLPLSTWPIHTGFSTRTMQSNTWKEHIRMTGCLFNTCCIVHKVRCWGGNRQKGIAKEQGHGRKSYKAFSLNPLYQIEEDVGKISFNKSWGINMLVFYV